MERHPKSEAEEKSSPNWLELPQDVTVSILQKLDAVDILENVQRVCTQWESICKDPSLWRTIIFSTDVNPFLNLESMVRQAVDRSCGGLVDLQLSKCGSYELLDYVTQRCTKIRRLRLVRGLVSDVGRCEAAKRLPLLEYLEISCCNSGTVKALRKFGECCPLLKSLKFNRVGVWEWDSVMDDSEAMSIAENMVELRHLQLFGNRLTNKGLKAILDSCIHLESLDLRRCFNLDLEDCSLRERCTEGIKDFREPDDSADDYEFDATVYDNEYYSTVHGHSIDNLYYWDDSDIGYYSDRLRYDNSRERAGIIICREESTSNMLWKKDFTTSMTGCCERVKALELC